jgi:hypothetical protein
MKHLPFLRQLRRVGDVLELAPATARREVRAGRLDARRGGVEHRRRLGAPKIFPTVCDVSLDGFSGDRAFDEDDATVDPSQCRPAVGQLADRQLH